MRSAPPRVRPAVTGARRACCLLLAAAALTGGRAGATVYEVGDNGSVRVGHSGMFEPAAAEPGQGASSTLPEVAPEVPAAAITTIAAPDVPSAFRQPLLSASARYALSPRLIAALAGRESAWRPGAISPKGAVGLTQLMPATARSLAVDPRDPIANLDGGARYLRLLLDRFGGNIERALAAYNAGPGRVARSSGVPAIPETRLYVTSIVDRLGIAAAAEGGR